MRVALKVGFLVVVGAVGFYSGRQASPTAAPIASPEAAGGNIAAAQGALTTGRRAVSHFPLTLEEDTPQQSDALSGSTGLLEERTTGSPTDLVGISPSVITGTVLSVGPVEFNTPGGLSPAPPFDPDDSSWDLYSVVVVGVERVYKGTSGLTRVVVSQRGGEALDVGGRVVREDVPSRTVFRTGDRLMLFTSGVPDGMYDDAPPWVTRALAVRDDLNNHGHVAEFDLVNSVFVYSTDGTAYSREDLTTMDIDDLQQEVEQAVSP